MTTSAIASAKNDNNASRQERVVESFLFFFLFVRSPFEYSIFTRCSGKLLQFARQFKENEVFCSMHKLFNHWPPLIYHCFWISFILSIFVCGCLLRPDVQYSVSIAFRERCTRTICVHVMTPTPPSLPVSLIHTIIPYWIIQKRIAMNKMCAPCVLFVVARVFLLCMHTFKNS